MAMYRIDGWDYYPDNVAVAGNVGINALADGWYNNPDQLRTHTGRFGTGLSLGFVGSVFSQQTDEAIGKRWTTQTCVVGQAFFIPSNLQDGWILGFRDAEGGNGTQFYLQFEVMGLIRLYRCGSSTTNSAGATLVATTAAKVWHEDDWNYIEVKFKIDNVAGTVEVRNNKVVVLSYAGPTRNMMTPVLGLAGGWDSLHYQCGIYNGDDSVFLKWDDRYILDDVGANNNNYLGNVRVNTQLTSGAGFVTQMDVFGVAANWDAVNERVLTDTQYVYTSVMGEQDLYAMDANVTAQNILAVQVTGAHKQDDATQLKSQLMLRTNATNYFGQDNFLQQTNYRYFRTVWDLNPFTGVGWTTAQLNAIQAGQQVQLG